MQSCPPLPFPYIVRLSKTKLLSLEMRRLRSDLIEDNAQLRGCETRGLLPATHRHWSKRSLSDHSQTALQTECAEIFITHRVVDTWNKLSEDTVNSKTVNSFKNQIDPSFKQHGGLYISQRRLHAPVIQTHRHTATN